MTLHEMILAAEEKSGIRANELREKGKTCIGCGAGFVPIIPGSVTCPKCLRGLKAKDGRP